MGRAQDEVAQHIHGTKAMEPGLVLAIAGSRIRDLQRALPTIISMILWIAVNRMLD